MEEIIAKGDIPPMPDGVKIRYIRQGDLKRRESGGILEKWVRNIVEKVRTGECLSLEPYPGMDWLKMTW